MARFRRKNESPPPQRISIFYIYDKDFIPLYNTDSVSGSMLIRARGNNHARESVIARHQEQAPQDHPASPLTLGHFEREDARIRELGAEELSTMRGGKPDISFCDSFQSSTCGSTCATPETDSGNHSGDCDDIVDQDGFRRRGERPRLQDWRADWQEAARRVAIPPRPAAA